MPPVRAPVATLWSPPPHRRTLEPAEVHVWCTALEPPPPDADTRATLCQTELDRASRLRFPEDRRRFLAAHLFLRRILASYLDLSPASLRFHLTPRGKPLLESHALHFNLSHSGNLALCAVRLDAPVGVDVEYLDPSIDICQLLEECCTPQEASSLGALPSQARFLSFFRLWTRKEAYLKATGQGLSVPLCDVDLDAHGSRWHVQDLDPAPGYAAAIATLAGCHLSCWLWLGTAQ